MKVTFLTDKSGRILAAHYRSALPSGTPSSRHGVTRIRPSQEQSLHEVEIPPELEQRLLKHTLAKELAKWRVERKGKTASLVKA